MRCPECGTRSPDNTLLCPQCGRLLKKPEPTPPLDSKQVGSSSSASPLESELPTRWQRLRPVLFWAVGLFCLLTLVLAGAAYGGLYQGERDRQRQRRESAEQHYEAGLERLEAGQYELAIAEFEYVLELDGDHPLAEEGIAEAHARQAALPTPTLETQEILVDDLYKQAVLHYEAEQWQDAAAALTQLRTLDPTYEAETVEEMLFTSLYETGMGLLEEDRFEEGIFYLDQAVALRPLDQEALTQLRLARHYLTALGYWEVDWERCIERFEQLRALAPQYRDIFRRLYRAHVMYANDWYAQGEMCPAEEQYEQALRLIADREVENKRSEAAEICLVATPTPIAPITGTLPFTLTELPPRFRAGRLAYPVYNTNTGVYDIYGLFADGRLTRVAVGADQPSWVWGSGALGYRNRLSPGLSLLAAGESSPQQVASGAGLTWPTFSPDGSLTAYSAQDAGGTWQIYIAPTDGSAEPTLHAEGKGPAWGPTGLLGWTGCDAEGTCGIFVDNPDDDRQPTRLTASINDIALHWAPGGDTLAYMSNVSGNWDIYRLSITGGVALLTDDPASDGLPAWAPDGSALAFISNREGTWGMYLIGPNGENPQKILALGPNLPGWTTQRLSWAP